MTLKTRNAANRTGPVGCPAALACGAILFAGGAGAGAYRPTDDSVVVATLQRSAVGSRATAESRRNLRGMGMKEIDLAASEEMAREYVQRAREEGDPRYLGRAEALLARWPDSSTAPVNIVVLRATIHQSLHRFERALRELDTALQRRPDDAQALLTRATVLQVLGRFPEAARDCAALGRVADRLVTITCSASVASLVGRGRAAAVLLDHVLEPAGARDPELQAWSRGVLAGIAERNGDDAAAERNYRAALALAPNDRHLLVAFADFLLDRGGADEVCALLEGVWSDDSLLLRRALALGAACEPKRAEAITVLADRYSAAHQRGDGVHLREEARFELQLRHDTKRALELAVSNWSAQKEPADAKLLLEAATAAGDVRQAKLAREWFQRAGVADTYLAGIVSRAARATTESAR